MNSAEATVVAATLAAGAVTLVPDVAEDAPSERRARTLAGTFVAVAFLLLLAGWAPQLAVILAVALLATAFALNGERFAGVIKNAL